MLNIPRGAKWGWKAPSDPTGNREKLKRNVKSHWQSSPLKRKKSEIYNIER